MKVPAAVKRGWEHRFPYLTGKWTHWIIMGDGALLGIVEGNNLAASLDLVEVNYGRFSSISVSRAIVDENGEISEEDNHSDEISRFIYDEKIRKSVREQDSSEKKRGQAELP
jgi:hypothetical protein